MKNDGCYPKMSRKFFVNCMKIFAPACGRFFSIYGFGGATSPKPGWEIALEEPARKIEELNSSTEKEFLEIGTSLQNFYQSAKAISRLSEAVAGLMSGERITAAIERLSGIFRSIEHMESEPQQHAEALDGILQTLCGASRSLAGFNRFIQTPDAFCTSIGIESARLGSNDIGFDTLADDIKKLTAGIALRFTKITNRLDSLIALIRMDLSRVGKLETTQRGQIRAIIAQTQSTALGPPGRTAARGVIELQAFQLRFAAGKLIEAVNTIVGHLQPASGDIGGNFQRITLHRGCAGDEKDSFLCGMEERLPAINSALHECEHANSQLTTILRNPAIRGSSG